jgi:hypothetical protein
VTDSVERVLDDLGYAVERFVTRSSGRGIAVASIDGDRRLVSVLGPGAGAEEFAERAPWDLELAGVTPVDAGGRPRIVLAERLPSGVSSTRLPRVAGSGVPPFAIALAEQVAAGHAAGETVGPLHPALVFAEPRTGLLAGCAQRPLRVAAFSAVGGTEGEPPIFETSYRTPGETRGEPPSTADDVFRLAAMCWRWRRGVDPFGSGIEELGAVLEGVPTEPPADELDRLLLRAFAPAGRSRPSARDLADAFRDVDASSSTV